MKALRVVVWVSCAALAWFLLESGIGGSDGHAAMLFCVLVCIIGMMQLGWQGRFASHSRMDRRLRLARIATWILLVVILMFWIGLAIRTPVRDLVWVLDEAVTPPTPEAEEDGDGDGLEQTTGHMDWNEGSRRALPRHTNIKLGKKPEVFLRIEDRSMAEAMSKLPIYVSSIGYDRYEDSAWHIAAESPGDVAGNGDGIVILDKQARGEGIWHTLVMSADAKRRSPLVSLQGLVKVEGFSSLERWSSCLYLLPQPEKPENGYRYRAASRPRMLRDVVDTESGTAIEKADPAWLRTPRNELGKRISELAQSIAPGGSAQEKARRIEKHLREQYRYSLATANPRNLDPLENFLFDEKSGHCEYFATAGALMARAAGIPSRVMYGWAGGTWFEYADWFVFRADEAHVWVELLLDERGWVVMDPTPPDALGVQRRGGAQEKMPLVPGLALEAAVPQTEVIERPVLPWVATGLFAVLGLAVLVRSRAAIVRAVDERIIPEPWRAPAACHYIEEWRRAARLRSGRPSLGSSTLRQQVRGLRPVPEFAEDLLGYHYETRYGGKPRDRARERKLTRRIRAWAAESKR